MMNSRIRYLPLLLLLIGSLLTSPASASGYVWCLSADGHAALEEAWGGDCAAASPAAPADPAEHSLGRTDGECGPCLDISSAHSWGTPRCRADADPAALPVPPVAVATTPPVVAPASLSGRFPYAPLPRLSALILHHRTVVLLI